MHTQLKRQLILLGLIAGLLWGGMLMTLARSGSEPVPLNPDAFVYIMNLGVCDTSIQYLGPGRNGFAVGDGRYILTAAHCVDDFEHTGKALRQPLVISPYYGDVFEAEIVAVDHENDIAVLKPAWQSHPGLELETAEWDASDGQITIAGYPPKVKALGGDDDQVSLAIRLETVPVDHADGTGNNTICVGPVTYVGKGWSGSPLVNRDTGRVAGITCVKQHKKASLRIRFLGSVKIPFSRRSYITGCDTAAIRALFEKHHLTCGPTADRPAAPGARKRFEQIVEAVDVLDSGDIERTRTVFERLADAMPNNAFAHLISGIVSEDGAASLQTAIRLWPDSDFLQAAYGCWLFGYGHYQPSADAFKTITDRDADHLYAWHGRLSALVLSDPNTAVRLGRRLTQQWPDSPDIWFELCKACRKQQHHVEELNAIETAIALCEPRPYQYQRYLADALGSNQRLADAQAAYRELLAEHQCAKCWSAYTALLAMMGPDKQAEARAALEKTRNANTDHSVSQDWFERYKQAIDAMVPDKAGADPNHTAEPESVLVSF